MPAPGPATYSAPSLRFFAFGAGGALPRVDPLLLLIPGLLIATAGMASLIWVSAPAVVIAGMCLFGIGFGITQNATFALLIDRAPASGYGTASALWNLAYDAGYGAGPMVFGVFVAHTGYPAAFALTGLLILTALLPAVRDRAAG